MTLSADLEPGARLDALQLLEDTSGRVTRLPATGVPFSATVALPAGSYRLFAAGALRPDARLTVRLLTPALRFGLPATVPAPARRLVDSVNLGDPDSEKAHAYAAQTWQWNVYPDATVQSALYPGPRGARVVDSGRVIPGSQQMTVATTPGRTAKLVLRYLGATAQRVRVLADGRDAGLLFLPAVPGWGEAEFLLPADQVRAARTALTFAPPAASADPLGLFYCWVYQ